MFGNDPDQGYDAQVSVHDPEGNALDEQALLAMAQNRAD